MWESNPMPRSLRVGWFTSTVFPPGAAAGFALACEQVADSNLATCPTEAGTGNLFITDARHTPNFPKAEYRSDAVLSLKIAEILPRIRAAHPAHSNCRLHVPIAAARRARAGAEIPERHEFSCAAITNAEITGNFPPRIIRPERVCLFEDEPVTEPLSLNNPNGHFRCLSP